MLSWRFRTDLGRNLRSFFWIPLIQHFSDSGTDLMTHLVDQVGMESSCFGQIPKAICSSAHWQIPTSGGLTLCFGTCTAQSLCWRTETSIIWGSGASPQQDLQDLMALNKERVGCHREAWPDWGKNILNPAWMWLWKKESFRFILLLKGFKSWLRG